ncbi:MAG: DUF5020 family protein [Paludibacter sp.]|jgi:hypothetical protein|nr:DUF5020 family protein [Paludibacter sp.]
MRKAIFALMLLVAMSAQAQTNLQFHYDFGKNRNYVTTTLEMFKPDKWGNTFFFVDFDYNMGEQNHPSSAYMEIARCLKFWNGPVSLHVEYNGGLGTFNAAGTEFAFPINNAYLVGLDYGLNNADFSKTLNIKALYKHIAGKQESAQLTAVWGLHFLNRKVSFTGFADLWLEDNTFGLNNTTSTVFISEPQLWYNFGEHFSVGTEVEIATNFAGVEGVKVCPTLGAKWNF